MSSILKDSNGVQGPVKHIVMWDVRGDTPQEKLAVAADIKARFEALLGVIPGLTCIEIGIDFSRISYACDVVLYSEFESRDALDQYATHPAHLQIRDALEGARIARHQVDYRPNGKRTDLLCAALPSAQPLELTP